MDLMREADAYLVEDVDDRVPAVGEIGVALLDDLVLNRREHCQVVPDRGSGETYDSVYAEGCGRTRSDLHLFGGPLAYALRIPVTPDPRIHHVLVTIIDDRLADGLAVEVIRDRPTPKSMLGENVLPTLYIAVVLGRLGDIKMITPAGD